MALRTASSTHHVNCRKSRSETLALSAALAATIALALPAVRHAQAYELTSPIDPAIAASPIEVYVWFLANTDPADVNPSLDRLRQGLDMLENVPTSGLAFTIVGWTIAATEPALPDEQLLVIAYPDDTEDDDVPYGAGGGSPSNGYPGSWVGLITDTQYAVRWIAHEIGHTVGFTHTTISDYFPPSQHPLMNWRADGPGILLSDDVAALSHHYPHPTISLASTTGTISGRVVSSRTGVPANGVNVVAVQVDDPANPTPRVARLTGGFDLATGTFELPGLPPGSYELYFLDGHSYFGSIVSNNLPPDFNGCHGLRLGFQADNFAELHTGPYAISAGSQIGVGDVVIDFGEMTIDAFQHGAFVDDTSLTPLSGYELPDGFVNQPYELWLHITGGQRDIVGQATGLPPGLDGAIDCDQRIANAGIHGATYFRIFGTPTTAGYFTLQIELTDIAGETETFLLNLAIQPLPPEGPVVHYHFGGNLQDASGNMRHGQAKWLGAAQALQWPADRNNVVGQALAVDGQVIEVPDEAAFDLRDYALAMVFKLDRQMAEDWLLAKGIRFGNYAMRRIGPAAAGNRGFVGFVQQTHEGNWSHLVTPAPVGAGQWTCLVVNISEDGFEGWDEGERAWRSGEVPPPIFNDDPLVVGGGGYDGLSDTMVGVLDDFAVYSGTLAPDAIADYCAWQILPEPERDGRTGASHRSAWNAYHLTTLSSGVLGDKTKKDFMKAADHLAMALGIDPKRPDRAWKKGLDLWLDGDHVSPKDGQRVFSELAEAVKLTGNACQRHLPACTQHDDLISLGESKTVEAARLLAETALSDAIATPGVCRTIRRKDPAEPVHDCPPTIEKARRDLAKGSSAAAEGKAVKAIESFASSWEKSIEAVRTAMAH